MLIIFSKKEVYYDAIKHNLIIIALNILYKQFILYKQNGIKFRWVN